MVYFVLNNCTLLITDLMSRENAPVFPQWHTGNTVIRIAKSYQLEMIPVCVL